MLYLLLSIIFSVTVGIIFKVARRYEVNITQIVAWNYVFAILLCYQAFNPDLTAVNQNAAWIIYLPLAILLPTIFLFLAASIKHMGIVKTDAAQRLSLFIPILAAYFLFKEDFNNLKFIGLAVGFPAIALILYKKQTNESNKWILPAVVLAGFGVIDILFKQIALHTSLPYTTSLFVIFCCAFVVALGIVLYRIIIKKDRLKSINLLFGALVGCFNFGNILFYLKAHKAFAENPSTVFAAMNIGVIVLGSFAGIFLFKEKLSRWNYAGIVLALAAISLITLSQIYV